MAGKGGLSIFLCFVLLHSISCSGTKRQIQQLYKDLIKEQFENYTTDQTPQLIAKNREHIYFFYYTALLNDWDESSMTMKTKMWTSSAWKDDQLKGWDPNSTYKWKYLKITPNINSPIYVADVRPHDVYEPPGETKNFVNILYTKWVNQISFVQTTMQCTRDWTSTYPRDRYKCRTYFQMQNFTKSHAVFQSLKCGGIDYQTFKLSNSSSGFDFCSDKSYSFMSGNTWKVLSNIYRKQRYFLVVEIIIERVEIQHYQLDVFSGVVLSVMVILNTLVPSSHKERALIGSFILLAIFNWNYLLDELPPTRTGEVIPLLYYYVAIATIQSCSLLWSMISVLLWKRGCDPETAFMPDWLITMVGYCSLVLAGWKVTGQLALLHRKLEQIEGLNAKKEEDGEESNVITLTLAEGIQVEFGGEEAASTGKDSKRSWHYFCLVIDRLFFILVLVAVFVVSLTFLG